MKFSSALSNYIIHLITAKILPNPIYMINFQYFKKIPNITDDINVKAVIVPKSITDKKNLITFISEVLNFPLYFGKNWDALYDCLCDLTWLKEKKIIFIHNDIPLYAQEDEKRKYLILLKDVFVFWQDHNEIYDFEVLFPSMCENEIESIFNTLNFLNSL